MVFSSVYFVFLFLPFSILAYYIFPKKIKNLILLITSIVFYSYGEPFFIFIIIGLIIINFLMARWIVCSKDSNKKVKLIITIGIDIAVLFSYKYFGFLVEIINDILSTDIEILSNTLPIGISFFTFQMISYVVDVYTDKETPTKNILELALYIMLYPQLIAGPIVRYHEMIGQIRERKVDLEIFGRGVRRFIIGFAKKVIIANNLSLVSDTLFTKTSLNDCSIMIVWLAVFAYALQIYYDFSGYSDMAIGLAKMYGFDIPENFNYPYIAKNVTDFWKRWHITLSLWFKDYIYIPMGGSRKGKWKTIRNLLVVWIFTGLWHGANYTFIVWSLNFFFIIIIEKYIVRPWDRKKILKKLWRLLTIIFVVINWVFFNASSINQALSIISAMFGYGISITFDNKVLLILREYGIYYVFGLFFSVPIIPKLKLKMNKKTNSNLVADIIIPLGYILVFLWAVSFLILGTHNPFIYFSF